MPSTTPELLHLCSSGDLPAIQEALGTTTSDPNMTRTLIAEALQNNHADSARYLLSISPNIPLGEDIIRWSIYAGSVPMLSDLLAKDPSILNMDFDMRGTPLAIAAMSKQPLSFLTFLLSSGADPNKPSDPLPMPLALAAKQYHNTAAVDLLLKYGANLEFSGALHAATHGGNVEMVRHLLQQGARPVTDVPKTPLPALTLHMAVKKGNVEITKMLMDYGADAMATDAAGKTAISLAETIGNRTLLEILLQTHR